MKDNGMVAEDKVNEWKKILRMVKRMNGFVDPFCVGSGVCMILGTPRPTMVKSIGKVSATMGVDQILYVKSERVDKSYFQSKTLSPEQMKKDFIHGAEQGVIRQIPSVELYPNDTLQYFIENKWTAWEEKYREERPVVKLIAEPKVADNLIRATFDALKEQKRKEISPMFVLAIGPEGGWIPSEVEMFKKVTMFASFLFFSFLQWFRRDFFLSIWEIEY